MSGLSGSFSRRTLRPECAASAAVSAMHPTRRRKLPKFRRNIISVGLTGLSSMHPELQSKPWYSAKPGSLTVIRPESRSRETAMPPSPKSKRKGAIRIEPTQRPRRRAVSRLNPMMACDTAFRIAARRHLGDLTANHAATSEGDPVALHQMRIALTRLRTAIWFFSPMVDDPERARIRDELKWLNAQLGTVRDLDVAIERLKAVSKQRPQATSDYEHWNEKRADSHRHLARALRSA